MTAAVPGVLSRIVDRKRAELATRLGSWEQLSHLAETRRAHVRDFTSALQSNRPAIIAEVKKASPSKGVLIADFQPQRIAQTYERGGAAAISVLTDERFFQGSLADLETARAACTRPALRKDFTIHEFQVTEAAAHGADAILLIAAILTVTEMTRFRELAESHGIAALVEVHDGDELKKALDSGARIVGVNNRNLHDFTVTLDTSLRLAEAMPAHVIKVSESGIHSAQDIHLLSGAGFGAFLVGEHLMKAPDPAAALAALIRDTE
jgi:indole-3-glycerol phosphate synthase